MFADIGNNEKSHINYTTKNAFIILKTQYSGYNIGIDVAKDRINI